MHRHHLKRHKQLLDDVDYEHVDFMGRFNANTGGMYMNDNDIYRPTMPPPGHHWSKELSAAAAKEVYAVLQKTANNDAPVDDGGAIDEPGTFEGEEPFSADPVYDYFNPNSYDPAYADEMDFAPTARDADYDDLGGEVEGAAAAEEEGAVVGEDLTVGLGESAVEGLGAAGALGIAGLAAWGLWQGTQALADWDKYKEGWEQAIDNLEQKGFVETAKDVVVDTVKDINSDIQIVGNTAALLSDPDHAKGQVASIEEELDTFDKANETVANAVGGAAMNVFNWFAKHI